VLARHAAARPNYPDGTDSTRDDLGPVLLFGPVIGVNPNPWSIERREPRYNLRIFHSVASPKHHANTRDVVFEECKGIRNLIDE